jgi:hypothetical protein
MDPAWSVARTMPMKIGKKDQREFDRGRIPFVADELSPAADENGEECAH